MKNLLVVWTLLMLSAGGLAGAPQTSNRCSAPEAAQFDFWVGEWILSWTGPDGKRLEGTNTVSRILGGCVIHESFRDPSTGFEGMSYSVYDTTGREWLQTWVDNAGNYLDFAGEFQNDMMVLQREAGSGEKTFLQRMVWYNISGNELDWNWERSDDDGETWSLLWKIHYVRKKK